MGLINCVFKACFLHLIKKFGALYGHPYVPYNQKLLRQVSPASLIVFMIEKELKLVIGNEFSFPSGSIIKYILWF